MSYLLWFHSVCSLLDKVLTQVPRPESPLYSLPQSPQLPQVVGTVGSHCCWRFYSTNQRGSSRFDIQFVITFRNALTRPWANQFNYLFVELPSLSLSLESIHGFRFYACLIWRAIKSTLNQRFCDPCPINVLHSFYFYYNCRFYACFCCCWSESNSPLVCLNDWLTRPDYTKFTCL